MTGGHGHGHGGDGGGDGDGHDGDGPAGRRAMAGRDDLGAQGRAADPGAGAAARSAMDEVGT